MQNPTKSQSVILVQRRYLLIMLQKCYNIYDPDIFICKSLHRPSLPTFTSFFGEVFLFWRGFWQIRISCKGKFLRPVVISPSLPSDGGISTMLWDNITEGWTRKKSYKETSRKHIWPTKKRADSLSSVFLHPLNYTYSSKLGGGGKTPSSDPKYL